MPSSRSRLEEPFVLNGMASLVVAAVYLFWHRDYLLQYFYFNQVLALTHLVALGFLSSLMMGVLHRLSPMMFGVAAASRGISRAQFVLFALGAWGMISHFWLGELTGMSWSTFMIWTASLLQLWNFRGLFEKTPKNPWPARFVAASLVNFFLAASLGVLLGLLKAYDLRARFFSGDYLDNVFAHAHVAGVGWVLMMIVGVELKLVPTTAGSDRGVAARFAMLQLGTIGVAAAWFAEASVLPFTVVLAVACVWHAAGPVLARLRGRAWEWEILPLLSLSLAAGLAIVLASGWPEAADPARARLQLAYAVLAVVGFMVGTVVSVAFKLFPMWVWQERFREDFGKRPVPGMKELHSERLRAVANVGLFAGTLATAFGVVAASETLLGYSTLLILLAIAAFVLNFVRVARWELLKRPFRPSPEDLEKFREMFPKSR